jgi:hypothetical protein
VQRHRHEAHVGHRRRRGVGVVGRVERDQLVPRLAQPEDRRGDRLGRAHRHLHLGVRVQLDPVEAALVLGDGPAQRRHAGQRRVLVAAVAQRRHRRLEHIGRPVLVGEALAEVDRSRALGERGHLREDRRAEARQAGGGGHPA